MTDRLVFGILGAAAILCLSFTPRSSHSGPAADDERARIERSIRGCIGWAGTKDFPLLYSTIANDADFLEVHPDGNVVKGFEEFKRAEKIWNSPDFKAIRYELRDLRIKLSQSRINKKRG